MSLHTAPDKAAAAAHYTAQAAQCGASAIAALIRRHRGFSADELQIIIGALASQAADLDKSSPQLIGADVVCERLDAAADACDNVLLIDSRDAEQDRGDRVKAQARGEWVPA